MTEPPLNEPLLNEPLLTEPLLAVDDLSVSYSSGRSSVLAVDGVSLRVMGGEAIGVVGESGSGKSTFVHALLGLLPNTATRQGRVALQGTDLTELSTKELAEIRGDVAAMVFQDPLTSFDPQRTIGYHMRESLLVHQPLLSRQARQGVVVDQLRRTGLPEPEYQSTRYPHQLSGGMLQRSMLALALENSPSLLLADEPTTALDVTIQAQILRLFADLLDDDELGASMLLISHDLAVVRQVCSRIIVMYAGRIVEDAPAEQLFAEPRHPYTQALIRATPRTTQSTSRFATIPGNAPVLTGTPTACSFRDRCAHAVAECHDSAPPLVSAAPGRVVACFVGATATLPEPETAEPSIDGSADDQRGTERHQSRRSAPSEQPAVQVDRVRVSFRTHGKGSRSFRKQSLHALRDVSLDIQRGETLGVVGESGSGKSTLARVILGLQKPTSGTVLVDGDDPTNRRGSARARQKLQAVFQDPHSSLNPRMTIEDAVSEPLRNLGVPAAERSRRALELLDEVQLGRGFSQRFPSELSGGQAQRVAIARALASEPDVIVLDEPTSGLDISIQAHILNLLADLQAQHGLTYVLISHDLAVVRHLADRIAVMYLGRVVELAAGADVFEEPAHPYTTGLLAAVPDIDNPRAVTPLAIGEPPSPLKPPTGCAYHTRCAAAQPICESTDPQLEQHRDGWVACHFPEAIRQPVAISADRPQR